MVYQTLYRRYRSQRFSDLRGQEHVVRALRSAVRDDRVGHAYLFSGPRGTGKTSTARILAKALNCDHLDDGDPCGTCESCRAIETGSSFDLHELDAASNNGVEAIRDLISRTGIGSPGRTKVYILDEVHMLSAGASNALLKTLEDPPPHVVFVLATTDPHKVLPTIRSRTQHLEFGLIAAEVMAEHVRWVVGDAGLDVDEAGVAYVLRHGGGSARDTLSALEQIVSAGGVPTEGSTAEEIIDALCERDAGEAMTAVASAMSVGREPRPLAEDLLAGLRDVFLASVNGPLDHLTAAGRERAGERAHRMGRAGITRALELVGEAIADMRHVGDTRIPLEVALVRLTRPELDTSVEALLDRVTRLERALATGSVPAASAAAPTDVAPVPRADAVVPEPAPPMPPSSSSGGGRPAAAARAALAESRGKAAPAPESTPPVPEPAPAPPSTAPEPVPAAPPAVAGRDAPDGDQLGARWPQVLARLSNRARARYGAGRFVVRDGAPAFALPNSIHRDRCEELRSEVEEALAAELGTPVALRLVVDDGSAGADPSAPPPEPHRRAAPPSDPTDEADDVGDVSDLADAEVGSTSSVERITELFPGAQVIKE